MHSKLIVALTLSATLAATTLGGNVLAQSPRAVLPAPTLGVALMGATISAFGDIYPDFSSGVVSAKKFAVGRYAVRFNRTLKGCTAAVTAASGAPRFAQFAGIGETETEVIVRTHDAAGAYADSDFTVLYFCGR